MGFCSRASLFLSYSIELFAPWQPKGSSEKISFQRLPFSSYHCESAGFTRIPRCIILGALGISPPSQILWNSRHWNWVGSSSYESVFWGFSFYCKESPPRDWKLKKKESHWMRQTVKLHPHTPFFKNLITFGASTLFYLSGKKISLVDQEGPVSLLSLKGLAEQLAPGNLLSVHRS